MEKAAFYSRKWRGASRQPVARTSSGGQTNGVIGWARNGGGIEAGRLLLRYQRRAPGES